MMWEDLLRKFFILQWKNYLLKRRHWVFTLFEIIIPTLLFVSIVAIRNTGGEDITPVWRDAVVERARSYPTQYCETLLSHTRNGSLSDMMLGYTNRPNGCGDCSGVEDSVLVADMMDLISRTVDNFLWPYCNVSASVLADAGLFNFTNVWNSTREQGRLILQAFEDEEAIVDENTRYQSNPQAYEFGEMLGGVVFREFFDYEHRGNNGEGGLRRIIPSMDYTMRLSPEFVNTDTDILFPVFQLSGPGKEGDKYGDFQTFQTLIDLAYIQIVTGEQIFPETINDRDSLLWMTATEAMPYPEYLENNLAAILDFMLPLFTVLSFCFIVPPLMKRIVHEKQSGVKELMKLMGLPNWMHWISWFLNAYVTSAISVAIMAALICIPWQENGAVLQFSNPFLIYIFFVLYASALIMSLFAISAFFDSPNLALALGVIVHIITYLAPSVYIDDQKYTEMSGGSKIGLSLLPNVALWWGIKIISIEEGRGAGVQFSNLGERSQPSDPMTMAVVLLMFAADMLIYYIVIWYVDGIRPGRYGVRKKWYFPVQPSYWLPSRGNEGMMAKSGLDRMPSVNGENDRGSHFEEEPEGEAGVVVRNLRKVFASFRSKKTVAVDDVTFSAYKGQITALLGHNGAGKTTTMSVLTGMYSPSGGRAFINGFDIGTQMKKARKSLGLCPQHNMLFADLTVREHLIFFAMLKGMSRKESVIESDNYVDLLRLEPKRDVVVTSLSGGMKRKVNLGIALIGGSEVVMLDEPTSGMDPEARRAMWDLLQAEKRRRTVLLTTHFMEEADVLGDRIAIMSKGRVHCYGSPLFLKRVFGKGYTLAMSRGGDCNPMAALGVVRSVVSGASMKSDAAGEVILNLPDSQVHKFAELFELLEREKERLDVLNFGLSVTTMEDVFIKVGSLADKQRSASLAVSPSFVPEEEDDSSSIGVGGDNLHVPGHRRELSLTSYQSQISTSPVKTMVTERLSGMALWTARMRGLLAKRFIYASRRWILYSVMALVPALIAVICQFVVNESSNPVKTHDAFTMTLTWYQDAITYINTDRYPPCQELADHFKGYASIVEDFETHLSRQGNLTNTILDKADEDLAVYRSQFVVAGDFQKRGHCLANGFCFDDYVELVGVYNTVPTHARPIVQNLLSNTLMAHLEGVESGYGYVPEHPITVTNHPLDTQQTWEMSILTDDLFISGYPFAYGVALSIGIGILVAAFVIFPLSEKVTNAKQVQMMTGLDPATFWLSNVLCDYVLYAASVALALLLLVVMDEMSYFTTNQCAGTLVFILLLYALCAIPMSYAVSYVAKNPASGFALIIVLNVLAGAIAPTAVWLLRLFGDHDDTTGLIVTSEIVRYLFLLMPAFPFARSIMSVIQIQEENLVCENGMDPEALEAMCDLFQARPETLLIKQSRQYAQCCMEPYVEEEFAFCGQEISFGGGEAIEPVPCHEAQSFYQWDALTGLNTDLIFFAVNIVFYCSLVVALELGYVDRWKARYQEWKRKRSMEKRRKKGEQVEEDELQPTLDEDVRQEQKRVLEIYGDVSSSSEESSSPHGPNSSDALVVTNLVKRFPLMTAVRGLTFGVRHGECFGLLGINGAGKTTTFRMLTGDEVPTEGSASLLGHGLRGGERKEFLRKVGYCPQFDSIIDVLTGREMLRLFGRLRGLPAEVAEAEIEHWIDIFGIREYADRQCGSYSGGNKRKLNVAMSLMGDPPIVFLDEPSTGVDPVARRRLWNIISSIRKNGQSIVLTSHSMEECEALCDRLCIMVNGQFQCLGGSQHLKNKFGQGYTILLKLNTRGADAERSAQLMVEVKEVVLSNFGRCSVKDEHKDYIHFHVGDVSTPWHRLFETMQSIKAQFPAVEDYSVSETTLEQVFLSFAKHQRQEDEPDCGDSAGGDEEEGSSRGKSTSSSSTNGGFVNVVLDSEGPDA